jgi:hypothetical protein
MKTRSKQEHAAGPAQLLRQPSGYGPFDRRRLFGVLHTRCLAHLYVVIVILVLTIAHTTVGGKDATLSPLQGSAYSDVLDLAPTPSKSTVTPTMPKRAPTVTLAPITRKPTVKPSLALSLTGGR